MQVVEQVIAEDRTVYGINTGFGLTGEHQDRPRRSRSSQKSIVLSHAAGIGKFMSDETVRLMMVLKINSLSRGYSGIRLKVINALIDLVNARRFTLVCHKRLSRCIHDLAPSGPHEAVLLGEGQARRQR
ncbi:aromatic amino acid lyase [Vibrio chagasii]|nr:aromatic amino acid lyase [Vibrio chagasii]